MSSSPELVRNSAAALTGRWHQINWKAVNREVQSLRYRVFKCSRTGNSKRLRSLQKLMIKSDSTLLLAIRKVTLSKTPGLDSVRAALTGLLLSVSVSLKRSKLLAS